MKESEESEVEHRGKIIQIQFDCQEQEQLTGANKPRVVGTLEELKISFITWL
jgi:hypothetical protein